MHHSDLWGPSPIVYNQGFKYYVIFVDEYTRYSWFFPLLIKMSSSQSLFYFKKQVENQLNRKIKVFQSDGGGEYISKQFKDHLALHGIQQRLSCPYTPNKMGFQSANTNISHNLDCR